MLDRLPDWKSMPRDRRTEFLAPLVKQGLSASQMAGMVCNASRNAIISHCARHGLKLGRHLAGAPTTTWPADRMAELEDYWREGKTAKQIAECMGVSRMAVISQARRMRLPSRARKAPAAPAGGAPKATERYVGLVHRVIRKRAEAAAVEPFDDGGVDVTDLIGSVKIEDLRASSCRFPLGDPLKADFAFCGKQRVPGCPYCPDHCHRAYVGFRP